MHYSASKGPFMNLPLLLVSGLLAALVTPPALAEETAPDVLVKSISEEVIAAIRQDKDIQAGDPRKIAELVEAKILPHFDFRYTTRIAMGGTWGRASPEQQEQLTREFRALLVRTYSGALAGYSDQVIEFRPLRAQPGDTEVTVRSQVRRSGAEPIAIGSAPERLTWERTVTSVSPGWARSGLNSMTWSL